MNTDRTDALDRAYASCRREAEAEAGTMGDLARRAIVYHRVFRHSGGNHVFPLLAAHGALWATGYFAFGMKVGRALSLLDIHRPTVRVRKLEALAGFADAFRDIHRRVCLEVCASYRFTALAGEVAGADRHVEPALLDALNRCHHSTRHGRVLGPVERRALYEAFFQWEQRTLVRPSIDAAVEAFDWERVRALALRPVIRFAYIPRRDALRFRDFSDTDERTEKGLRAYAIAERVGWDHVERTLGRYGILPSGLGEPVRASLAAPRARSAAAGPARFADGLRAAGGP